MNNFKIIGTGGKKRRKAFGLLVLFGIIVAAIGSVIICTFVITDGGGVLAGQDASETWTDDPENQAGSRSGQEEKNPPGTAADIQFLTGKEEPVSEDERELSFGPMAIGPNIRTGDFIDIRLMCADGTDYIVVSKKELIDYNSSTGMSVIRVRESELLTLNSAMADRNSMTGVTLYAVRYVDPLSQSAADISYQPNEAVSNQIKERVYDAG